MSWIFRLILFFVTTSIAFTFVYSDHHFFKFFLQTVHLTIIGSFVRIRCRTHYQHPRTD